VTNIRIKDLQKMEDNLVACIEKLHGTFTGMSNGLSLVTPVSSRETTHCIVKEPGAIYLHEMTEPFIGISERGMPWDIQNRTACVAQPRRLARINPFLSF
jgi:hypothetical protein